MRNITPFFLSFVLAVCLSCALACALASPALAAAPGTVALEGLLRTTDGGAVSDGDYSVTFALYASDKAAVPVWTEGQVKLSVKAGRFGAVLGTVKAITPAMLTALSPGWLGVRVAADPELTRVPLRAVPWAIHAAAAGELLCSGCVQSDHLKAGSIAADRVAFTWAGSKTKGGPASSALDLNCTGCVGVEELKIDGDLDLGGNALKAKAVTASTISAATISASAFVGDGSKLTGIQSISGTCKVAGEAVTGIAADGSLICSKVAVGLPPDGLDEISNGLLTNEFMNEIASGNAPTKIPDNNPTGVGDEIEVPDLGLAAGLWVDVHLTNSDLADVTLELYDPANKKYVLYDKSGKGTEMKVTYPEPTKPAVGDLGPWLGKNPKGKWRLRAVDTKHLNNTFDGAIEAWAIRIKIISDKQVEAKGKLIAGGGLQFAVASKPPLPCDAANKGFAYLDDNSNALRICNGKEYYDMALSQPGTQDSPAASCAALLKKKPSALSAIYWLDVDASGPKAAFPAWCDMKTSGGGWTLALNLDTSDGHVMWWGNALWTNTTVHGDVAKPFDGDLKSPAYVDLAGAGELLLVVHEQGAVKGWRHFKRPDTKTLLQVMQGGDNSLLGSSVMAANVGGVWQHERLVRVSTKLYANHCVASGGGCVSGSGGSPDGDRVGSNEGTPKDNDGGGLGNWHDMGYCCAGQSYGSGKKCNGSAFRTTSEAQAGWAYNDQYGTFGTDSFGKVTGTQNDGGCGNANWAKSSGVNYDYSIYIR